VAAPAILHFVSANHQAMAGLFPSLVFDTLPTARHVVVAERCSLFQFQKYSIQYRGWCLRNATSANDIQLFQVASHKQVGLLVLHTYHA
jgi:hypothetical protein